MMENHNLLTIGEVANRFHVTTNTVKYWCGRGLLNPIIIGTRGDRFFEKSEVAELAKKIKSGNVQLRYHLTEEEENTPITSKRELDRIMKRTKPRRGDVRRMYRTILKLWEELKGKTDAV